MRFPSQPVSVPGCARWLLLAVVALAAAPAAAQDSQRVRWRFEIPADVSGSFVGVGADGRVYTTSFDPPNLYALTPQGTLVWSLGVGAASGHWPITFAADGTIYTGAIGVRAVNPDGTLRWEFDPGSWIIAGPSVGPDGNIYAADDARTGGLGFFSLDADGHLRWSSPGDPVASGVEDGLDEIVFGGGRIFGGIHFRRSGPWIDTYAFDLDGHQLWYRFYGADGGPSSNPRPLPDGRLAFRWGQGSLAALEQSGTEDWVEPHPGGAQVLVPPAVGPDGVIYAGDGYGVQLWSANPDGTLRWVQAGNIDEHLASLGVSPDNRVLVASGWTWSAIDAANHGWIRGYAPANGELLWQVDLELEQGQTQATRTVRPTFSRSGDTAYLTTWFVGNGVGHTYLYAIAVGEGTTEVPADGRRGLELPLLSVSPNPCVGSATILLRAAKEGPASVTVYDLAGRAVRRLFEGHPTDEAVRLEWDLRDQAGRAVDPGVYFVAGRTAERSRVVRAVVTK